MVNIFNYQNFRVYLKDYYKEQKKLNKRFSYRYFSEKAGASSPTFLLYVIENKRNLTESSILKISQAIGHSREEADYFECLVFFNQAMTINEKSHYYAKLIEIRRPLDMQTIDSDRYIYYSKWYYSVVREVVTFFDFGNDYSRLGAFLIPPISGAEAKDAIRLLEKLAFIELDKNGRYHQTSNLVMGCPNPLQSFQIERFQMEMLELAMRAYDMTPFDQRLSTSTTLSVSMKTVDLFKSRIREFQNDIMEIARMDDQQEQSVQININLFPISRICHE